MKYKGTFPPDLKKDQWWRVSWFFRDQDGSARFYTDVFKANIDAVDVVEHKGAWFEDAIRAAFPNLQSNTVDTPADLQSRVQVACDLLDLHTVHRHLRALELLGEESPKARFFAVTRRLMLDLMQGRTDTTAVLLSATTDEGEPPASRMPGWW